MVVQKSTSTDLCILGKVTRVECDTISFQRLHPSRGNENNQLAKRPQHAVWIVRRRDARRQDARRQDPPIHEIKKDDPRLIAILELDASNKLSKESVDKFFQCGLQYEVESESPETIFSNKSVKNLNLEGVRMSASRVYLTFRDKHTAVREKKKTYRV